MSIVKIVAKGDTFWGLAKTHGVSVKDIREANSNVDPLKLAVGARVTIPERPVDTLNSGQSVPTSTVPPKTTSGLDPILANKWAQEVVDKTDRVLSGKVDVGTVYSLYAELVQVAAQGASSLHQNLGPVHSRTSILLSMIAEKEEKPELKISYYKQAGLLASKAVDNATDPTQKIGLDSNVLSIALKMAGNVKGTERFANLNSWSSEFAGNVAKQTDSFWQVGPFATSEVEKWFSAAKITHGTEMPAEKWEALGMLLSRQMPERDGEIKTIIASKKAEIILDESRKQEQLVLNNLGENYGKN